MDLLQPHLLTRDELKKHLEKFHLANLDELTKDELVQLFIKYVMPKPSRRKSPETIQIKQDLKRLKIQNSSHSASEDVPMHEDDRPKIVLKRSLDQDYNKTSPSQQKQPAKRQKITWP